MINCAVIIPALNPTSFLNHYVKQLTQNGIAEIIVINDGSSKTYHSVFTELNKLESCTVLSHTANLGKGIALKTAFSYYLKHFPYLCGVVTADADGQHTVEDVCKVAEMISNQPEIIMGVRDFTEEDVPLRSYTGNKITGKAFERLFHVQLSDTQTGLRGIPAKELNWMQYLKGERYEYEINMLINAVRRDIKLTEVSIQTIYADNNSGSYYSTFRDSMRIITKLISGFFRKKKLMHMEQMENR